MEWLSQNWFFVLILVIFVGMHAFGGCGGQGGHGKNDKKGGPERTGGHGH